MSLKRSREENPATPASITDDIENGASQAKFTQLDVTPQSDDKPMSESIITCSLPPHTLQRFTSSTAYETHIITAHSNRCRECNKNLPSPHFLDLHIAENHDPFFASQLDANNESDRLDSAKARIYACFVPDCPKVCVDWKKRRSHLVDKHSFPRNYDFFVVNSGIDGRASMLRPGIDEKGHRASSRERGSADARVSPAAIHRESAILPEPPDSVGYSGVGEPVASSGLDPVAEITTSMQKASIQRSVPHAVSFGRRKGGAGFAKS